MDRRLLQGMLALCLLNMVGCAALTEIGLFRYGADHNSWGCPTAYVKHLDHKANRPQRVAFLRWMYNADAMAHNPNWIATGRRQPKSTPTMPAPPATINELVPPPQDADWPELDDPQPQPGATLAPVVSPAPPTDLDNHYIEGPQALQPPEWWSVNERQHN